MTTEMMGWLNQNRHRSYPMIRDEWREKVSADSGLDAVLLDALVFDSDSAKPRELVISKISISRESTTVLFSYGDKTFNINLGDSGDSGSSGSGGDEDDGFVRMRGIVAGEGRNAAVSLVFSSHSYLKGLLPDGEWDIGCRVMPSRVISLSDGYGVDRISTNGSEGVEGHESAADADGDVVLEDGYRTSPIISNGNVLVRVGRRYGYDPCGYDYGDAGSRDCRKPLFFFCGQNAVNNGNISLKGGAGISIAKGGSYKIRDDEENSKCAGKTIPAIEIIAGQELMDLYKPQGEG